MSGNETYIGRHFKFKIGEKIGKGGNGAVYNAIMDEDSSNQYVVKFFEYTVDKGYSEEKAQERYVRFRKEISTVLDLQSKVKGIMEILDYNCPDTWPITSNEAWYIMKKAGRFSITYQYSLKRKLLDMMELAEIIYRIHEKGFAHRDIKPDNLLILNNHIYLSDFGLVWSADQDRITGEKEVIGPGMIRPPELEAAGMGDLDFRPSDVYLFAKVLWMVLKEDAFGFRGQYNRQDNNIYINPERFDADTLEPIHLLLEKTTCDSMDKRLTIEECIQYLQLQINIIDHTADENLCNKLRYDEVGKYYLARNEADQYVYKDKQKIYYLINNLIDTAKLCILSPEGKYDRLEAKDITFSNNADGSSALTLWVNGRKIKEYIFFIDTMVIEIEDKVGPSKIIINLNTPDKLNDEIYIFHSKNEGLENVQHRVMILAGYKIVFLKQR